MKHAASHLTRRRFLETSGALGLGALLAPSRLAAAAEPPKVPRRPFGKTGIEVPVLSLGGIFDTINGQAVLRQAFNHGVTYWDTAEGYLKGASETGMGLYLERNPEARKSLFLVTKSGQRSVDKMTTALDASLARLQTGHVDLFFMHAVSSIGEVDRPEVKAWAEAAKKAGKIRLFGFSTHTNMEPCLAGAAKLGWIDGVMLTYNYRIMHTPEMKAAIEAAVAVGIGLTAMKTIGKQSGSPSAEQARLLEPLTGRGFSPEQAMMRAVWENPAIAAICSQMPNVDLLRKNIAAALDQTSLAESDREALRRYADATCSGYCAGCGHLCEGALAGAVPVRDVMRHLMYHRHYGPEIGLAAELPAEVRQRLVTTDYAAAELACPRRVPIARFMREAAATLAV
jgi:hypothetical protein